MLSKWPIRNKLLVGIGLLLALVVTLSTSGFLGVYSYRSLVKSLSNRAAELPLATALGQRISDLRVTLGESRPLRDTAPITLTSAGETPAAESSARAMPLRQPLAPPTLDDQKLRAEFRTNLRSVQEALDNYVDVLGPKEEVADRRINDAHQEHLTVAEIQEKLDIVATIESQPDWINSVEQADKVNLELEKLQTLAADLPSHLHMRIHDIAGDVRTHYRTLIGITWLTTLCSIFVVGLFVHLFYRWVFRPLRLLVKGSRRVAAGEFGHRIRLQTRDEMSELAEAMNDMTARFQDIRDDLDRQVQMRTKQVVRSEQMASVGFLAAGVAHEINNPLASIAMCAESLESRMHDLLVADAENGPLVRQYLQMIQNEAFRCKEITEKLLDFSRTGEVKRQNTDLCELIRGVLDMVRHLGKYQHKHIRLVADEPLIASVNSQEIKQVVLNLITNGLDSVDTGGTLTIELARRGGQVEMMFSDDGCGMSEEVLEHLFEPFFTRKRGGQGTGLGLSIVYRIVAEHEGHIDAASAGPGQGSQFRVRLPLAEKMKETHHRYQAA